ncbi:MAG: peroxidase, partial [Pseudomonadota bacterium]
CYGAHKATAAAFGVESTVLEALVVDTESAPIEDNMRPVLAFARKLTLTPSRVVQHDVDAVLEAGWTEKDFHYLVSICSLFNFYNRLMDGYGCSTNALPIPLDDMGQILADGYIVDS